MTSIAETGIAFAPASLPRRLAAGLTRLLTSWRGGDKRPGGPARRWRLSGKLIHLVPALMLLAALALRIENPTFLQNFQFKVFDLYQQLAPRPYQPVPVRIINVDDESLARLGQWPWPRTHLANMLARLFDAGAAVVAFDAVFAEPDRTSPSQVLPVWKETPELAPLKAAIRALPDHDEIFAEMIGRSRVVLGFALTTEKGGRIPATKAGIAIAGDDPKPFIAGFSGAATNLPIFEKAAAGSGSFNLAPERDNIVRRVPLMVRLDQQIYPALAAEALRVAQGASTYVLKASGANMESSFGERTGLNNVKIGQFVVPVDGAGRMWVHYTREVPERFIPAWKLFEPDFDPASVEGQILFFGTDAAGLKDLRTTPLNPAAAGVEVHVQATEQILLGHFLGRPDWADGAEILFILILGVLLILLTPRLGALPGAAIGVAALAVAVALSWYLFRQQRLLLDPLYPALAIVAVYMTGSLLSYLRTEAEKRQVRGAFAQYLSPALVEQLAREPERLKLGGEMKNMTFLFSDIRGFTTISERFKSNPQGLTKLINQFLTPMTDIILARRGTIDKYMGDCIMAFWNAPLDNAEHARHACDAALAMVGRLQQLNDELTAESAAQGGPPMRLNVGVGVNTGDCVVGNMGSQQRFDYSVLGDAVNLASRLEGQSKNYGITIVVGSETREKAAGYAFLELDLIAVKGKKEAVRIFTLHGDNGLAEKPEFNALRIKHEAMLAAYRQQDWIGTAALIAECRPLDPRLADFYDIYDERLAYFRDNPPGADWDGVYVATSK